jgi:serine/threonine-protein kinase SRPK3
VLTVNATAGILNHFLDELEILKKVTTTDSGHAGYKHCITLRDCFVARSKHGPHIRLVTDVLGMDMSELQHSRGPFPISVVKRIIKQTLLALDYLHRGCHIVHTGELSCSYPSTQPIQRIYLDVKPGNILVSLEDGNGNEAIHAYLLKNPSASYEPRVEPDLSLDPIITVKTQPLPNFQLDPNLTDIEIRLIDYGHGKKL